MRDPDARAVGDPVPYAHYASHVSVAGRYGHGDPGSHPDAHAVRYSGSDVFADGAPDDSPDAPADGAAGVEAYR